MKKTALLLAAVLLVAAAVWYSYYDAAFTHLFLNDAMDYASIGRNVSRGDGFVSSYITPLGLANREGLPHPDLWRAPLWPAVLGAFIRVLGATDQVVAIATGSFFIAGAGVVFLLGREMFGRVVGLMSSLVYIFSAQNLVNSVSGMTETISAFMMALVVYLAVARWTQNRWGDILGGAALGLFYLTRYNALLFVPFFALLVWYKRRGLRPVARYLAAFAIIVSPWLVRNYLLMGSPFFSLQKFEPVMFTAAYPAYSLYMMMEKVDVPGFIMSHPQEIWAKVVSGWAEFTAGLFNPAMTGVSPYLFGLFLASLVIPFGYRWKGRRDITGYHGVRLLLAACFAVQLAALLVIHFIYRLFFIFLPLYIIFGIAAMMWLLSRGADLLPVRRRGFAAVFSLLLLGVFIFTNLPAWSPVKAENIPLKVLQDSVRGVTDMSTRQELIISNDGHLLAWYGDRYAAKIPYSVDMIPEMERLAPVKLIYLSSRISWNIPEADRSWAELYWGKPNEIYGFKKAVVYPDGSVVYKKE